MPGGPCSTLQRGSKHTMQAHGATKRHAHSWLWALAVLQGWWKGKFNSFLGDSMVQDYFHHPCGQTGHRLDTVSPIQVFSKAPKSPPLQASVWPEAHLAVTAARAWFPGHIPPAPLSSHWSCCAMLLTSCKVFQHL